MKLTNKILLTALGIIFILIPVNKLIFKSKIEVINTFANKPAIYKAISYMPSGTIEISGKFEIHIAKNDSFYLKIKNPDEWISESYISGVDKGRFYFRSTKAMNNIPHIGNLWINSIKIDTLIASKGAIVYLENFSEDEVNIHASDSSVIFTKNCSFNMTKLTGSRKSTIYLNKTNEAWVQMTDFSNVSLVMNNGSAFGSIDKTSDYVLQGNVSSNKIIISNN